jgi:non-ribosomal peptide synthetase component F
VTFVTRALGDDGVSSLDELPANVRAIVFGGEPLHGALVDRLYACSSVQRVIDVYGPTETTVYATCAIRPRNGRATIGRPIAGTTAYVLDARRQPVPIGVTGELYLGGAGLARGISAARSSPRSASRSPV